MDDILYGVVSWMSLSGPPSSVLEFPISEGILRPKGGGGGGGEIGGPRIKKIRFLKISCNLCWKIGVRGKLQ